MAMHPEAASTSAISTHLTQPVLTETERGQLGKLAINTQRAIQELTIEKQKLLLTNKGIYALRQRLIEPNDAEKILPYLLKFLLTDFGLLALEKKTIDIGHIIDLTHDLRAPTESFSRQLDEKILAKYKKTQTEKSASLDKFLSSTCSPPWVQYYLQEANRHKLDKKQIISDARETEDRRLSDLISKFDETFHVTIPAYILLGCANAIKNTPTRPKPNKAELLDFFDQPALKLGWLIESFTPQQIRTFSLEDLEKKIKSPRTIQEGTTDPSTTKKQVFFPSANSAGDRVSMRP